MRGSRRVGGAGTYGTRRATVSASSAAHPLTLSLSIEARRGEIPYISITVNAGGRKRPRGRLRSAPKRLARRWRPPRKGL
jgi:hypothetical protein